MLDALLHLTPGLVHDIRRHFHEIRRLTTPHFEREEEVFYSAIRDREPALLARMDQQHAETRQIEGFLDEVLAAWPEAPVERDLQELHRLGIEFHDAVQTHIIAEEDDLLALADRSLSCEEQVRLLAQMDQTAPAAV